MSEAKEIVLKVYPHAVACQSFSDGLWQILDGPPVKQGIAKHHLTYETESSAWEDAASKLPNVAPVKRKTYSKNGYRICRCGVLAMPLTDDTSCDCGDIYEQEWNFVEVVRSATQTATGNSEKIVKVS